MRFTLTNEEQELRDTLRRFLASHLPVDVIRRKMESDEPMPRALWSEINNELGLAGALVPEQHGGLGLGFMEAAVVLQEIGRGVAPLPFLSSSVLAVGLLSASDHPRAAELLGAIAAGEAVVALAPATTASLRAPSVELDGGRATGHSRFVLDGQIATHLLVMAEPVTIGVVDTSAVGVTLQRLTTLDLTRPMAEVTIDRAPCDILLEGPTAARALARAEVVAACGIAQDMVGGAARVLEFTLDYAKARHQFGRPIGSFQAIKHRLADMLVDVECATSSAMAAASSLAEDAEDAELLARMAKSYCGDAYYRVAAASIQVHGGIGFTWEHDCHLYFKRAKADQLLFGDGAGQRMRVGELLGISGVRTPN